MHSDHLIWQALSDPTRRAILTGLRERPRTTGDIAADFEMSRIAVMRHLGVLAEAELVTSRKVGRQRWHYVNLPPLVAALRTWSEPLNEQLASALLRLKDVAERGDATTSVDIAIDVVINAQPSRVFAAMTQDFAAWWGHPFLRPETTSLTLDPRLGGLLTESWENGGQVVATVTGIDADRWLQLTGSFHLGIVYGNADLTLEPEGEATRVSLTFRGFGIVNEAVAQSYSGGWRELITLRLKRFVEEGVRLGIDQGQFQEGQMTSEVLHEDAYGEVIDRPEAQLIEIRWFDGTSELDSEAFNQWLAGFATLVESTRRPRVLVDSIVFRMDMAKMDGAWRDANIIPRYNAAGVKKFAFLMPDGMPAIGSESVEAPGTFPTAYFGRREDALGWLKA